MTHANEPSAPLRAVIVDDEPLARDGLARSIARLVTAGELPPITVVATCDGAPSARDALRRLTPDIVLVDVQMPGMSGIELLESLEPEAIPAAVLFVTAYDSHALRAFGVHALDYLVKPVPEARLRDALHRAATRVAEVRALRAMLEPPPTLAPTPAAPYVRQIVIPERGVRRVVPVHEIEWIEGETYYVRIHAQGRGRLLRERLGALEAALDPSEFFRTHRSAIVRLALVRELRAESPHSSSVLLATGARVPLARDRHRRLEELLRGRVAAS